MAIWTHRVSTSFLQIADTCRSCVCGHVFDADVKQIAGKRFSGTHLLKLDIALICLVGNIHRARQQEVSATPGVEGVLYFGFWELWILSFERSGASFYYSGCESPRLKMGSFFVFVFCIFLGGSTSGVYADWLARRQ